MNYAKWIAHFTKNRAHRPEPDWTGPVILQPAIPPPLIKSLEQFRLGDGGGPASFNRVSTPNGSGAAASKCGL